MSDSETRETSPALAGRLARTAVASVALWAALVLIFSTGGFLESLRSGDPEDYMTHLASNARAYAPWLLFGPAVFRLARHHAVARVSLHSAVLSSMAAAFGIFAAYCLFFGLIAFSRGDDPVAFVLGFNIMAWFWDIYLFLCVYFVGRLAGAQILRANAAADARRAETAALALQADIAKLESKNLRHRFSSHFVMNALSNILGLVRSGAADQAERAILILSDILKRLPRDDAEACESTLGEELEFLSAYLAFQRIRYPDIDYEIDAPDVIRDCRLPPQSLQPIVENMFKHGLSPDGALHIRISARRARDRLRITLENSVYDAIAAPGADGEGVRLVKGRLEMAFADQFALARTADGDAYRVSVDTPAERAV